MATFRSLLALFMLALAALPASAAEPTYPPGSRIGLAPPAGLVPSKTFFGYEDLNNSVAMILVALPPQAYADLDASVTADALKRQGMTMDSREALPLPSGKAFLVVRSAGRRQYQGPQMDPGGRLALAHRIRHRADAGGGSGALSRRGDPRFAGHAGVSRRRSDRGTTRAAAVQGW